MSFIDKLSARLPFGKKEEELEYFFALNIGAENLTAALWTIDKKELRVLETASASYSSSEQILSTTDKLLDQVLGIREIEPQKILFGVPNSWLLDEDLKEDYLKLLRRAVKELELSPMAYVATAHAIIHFLEKQEGVPTTAILVGFEAHHLTVTVVRAGKLDGVKVINRGDSSGADIEKALLNFTDVETLPSKILIYGLDTEELEKLKGQLLSFPWMAKLSFLHFPKIEILTEEVGIKSICLAGASEINSEVIFTDRLSQKISKSAITAPIETTEEEETPPKEEEKEALEESDLGFVVGDVSEKVADEQLSENELASEEFVKESELMPVEDRQVELDDFEDEAAAPPVPLEAEKRKRFNLKKFFPKGNFTILIILSGVMVILGVVLTAYLFLVKAEVKIFVEPRVLERDAQVTADPKQKEIDEEGKIIPAQTVETEVTGSAKDQATGKKQIGDPAKGTVVLRNKADSAVSLSKGTTLTSNNLKFSLDSTVNIASRSADDGTWGKSTAPVTAEGIGADGNLPSGSDLLVSGYSTSQVIAKAEGNFSGGTSKDVTVVSDTDQKRLLASLASDLRKKAQQQLQEKLPSKKILEEALSEEIIRRSYSKNINDQANEFSLNMTIRYKGTAFEDKDLRLIVSKLVTTQVPDGFQLDLSNTETQADVSKLEKDGRVIFLARFKAKLLPKLDEEKIKNQIKGKSAAQVEEILKGLENVLGSDINMMPSLPPFLQRLPLLSRNIKVEVGLK